MQLEMKNHQQSNKIPLEKALTKVTVVNITHLFVQESGLDKKPTDAIEAYQ